MKLAGIIFVIGLSTFFSGCATRSLPPYEPPLKRSEYMNVRTTSYTDTEKDHLPYSNYSASGTSLLHGFVRSAAADWSRWPAGTKFVVLDTGQFYEVDDYGWALAGRNTLDLYSPTREEMNDWGVKEVTIHVLEWGDPWRSYQILKPRRDYAHVRRMLTEIRSFY
ncbi:MAG: hypothetical protein JOY96_02800 [Verrucomicrobia bacterium]|nr:hypothetical protein [Verrucomicrobiota bacterium]